MLELGTVLKEIQQLNIIEAIGIKVALGQDAPGQEGSNLETANLLNLADQIALGFTTYKLSVITWSK
jgi:hypothetical protein